MTGISSAGKKENNCVNNWSVGLFLGLNALFILNIIKKIDKNYLRDSQKCGIIYLVKGDYCASELF